MDKKTLYDSFTQIELDTDTTLHQISKIKKEVETLVEENATLLIENQHLRDRLSDLEKLYEDGFHVCNVFYGSRRVNDEPCAFCLDVIYGERR